MSMLMEPCPGAVLKDLQVPSSAVGLKAAGNVHVNIFYHESCCNNFSIVDQYFIFQALQPLAPR